MKIDGPHSEATLASDFAHRVVQRVRNTKRRRRVRRWVLISAVASTSAVVAISSLLARNSLSPQPSTVVANRDDLRPESESMSSCIELGRSPDFNSASLGQPLAFFFPNATTLVDFQPSDQSSWHSYDPWWNPNL